MSFGIGAFPFGLFASTFNFGDPVIRGKNYYFFLAIVNCELYKIIHFHIRSWGTWDKSCQLGGWTFSVAIVLVGCNSFHLLAIGSLKLWFSVLYIFNIKIPGNYLYLKYFSNFPRWWIYIYYIKFEN